MEDYSKGLWMASKVYAIISDNSDMITLKSTHKKNPKPFSVNKAVLCHYSTFFHTAYNGSWKESHQNKTVFELDIPQRVLRLFHGWLCTGRILTDFEPDPILKLYIYGDYIGCVALQRAVVSHLHNVSKGADDPDDYDGIVELVDYQSLHKNNIWTEHQKSGLYRFIVDTYGFHWRSGMDEPSSDDDDSSNEFNIPEDIPVKFLYDVLKITSVHERSEVRVEYRQPNNRAIRVNRCHCCSDICKYHEHPNDKERLATCGASLQEESELLGKFWSDDTDDNDDGGDKTFSEGTYQAIDGGMEEGTKKVDGNDIEDTGMDVDGKRKAHDDGEEEEVSTKKHKQEEAEP